MSVISYPNSQSTLTLNGYTFTDLMEGEALSLAPVNERTSRTNSTGGGVSISNRIDGGVHTLTIMVQRNSDDDTFLNNAMIASTPTIFEGSMKRAYSQNGTSKRETISLSSGSFTTQPTTAENNQDANNSETYVIEFRDAQRKF